MKPLHRSVAGAVIALLTLPAFLGLMACLPVPIGDPEKSRIDPELTGMWFVPNGFDGVIVLLEPFDKRAWLMTSLEISLDEDVCPPDEGADEETSGFELFATHVERSAWECYEPDGSVALYKVWTTRLSGQLFMVWEPKVMWLENLPRFQPSLWFGFRLNRTTPNQFSLDWVDPDYFEGIEGFQALMDNLDEDIVSDPREIRRVSRKIARSIRRNVDDPDLYDDEFGVFHRVPHELQDDAFTIIDDIVGLD